MKTVRVVYPDLTHEDIQCTEWFAHSSGGFGFYQQPEANPYTDKPMIFVSATNVRKIYEIVDSTAGKNLQSTAV